ncbi:MAG: prepilin-type N-terminal cleavage/methylation domain-containing protein [Phycisphaerales bacterium]|jgi:prepilin-type N-terminal cleavage/methylation domain-containing protein
MNSMRTNRRAFSLIELVIVVVIIGIIGAIAIPRMSRGAAGAADSSLIADLAVLRNAIDLYHTEHQGTYPTLATFEAEMTTYSQLDGTTSASKTATAIYGPYLRSVPKLKVKGTGNDSAVVIATLGGAGGWVYDDTTGAITANSTDTDDSSAAYNTY